MKKKEKKMKETKMNGRRKDKRVTETGVMGSSDGRTKRKKEKIFYLPYLFSLTNNEFPVTIV